MGYQEVEVPVGNYISWGSRKGQYVEGELVDYDEFGGRDYGNNPCPLLEIELTTKAASINKEGNRTDYEAGETVYLTCGQANLKKKVKRAELKRGNQVKITLSDLVKVPDGTLKEFTVLVDRSGTAESKSDGDFDSEPTESKSRGKAKAEPDDDDEPPF